MSRIRKSVISLVFVAALFFCAALFAAKTTVRAEVTPTSISELAENTFVMEKGASIRAYYQDGLRYSAAIPKSAYESLVAKYGEDKISFGTFILPNYYVVNYGAPNAENCFGENPIYVWDTESCGENQHIVLHNTKKNVNPLGEYYIADGYVIGMKNATRKNLNVLYSGYVYLKAVNADGASEYLFASQNDNDKDVKIKVTLYFTDALRKMISGSAGASDVNRHTLIWDSRNDGIYRNVSEKMLVDEAKAVKKFFPAAE